jgi:sulfur transfer complex TusBCD TusB component (DsrH family)
MKRILHILKRKDNPAPLEIIREQSESNELVIILIQDAVGLELKGIKGEVFALADDLKGGETPAHPPIGYKEMLGYILDSESVVTW